MIKIMVIEDEKIERETLVKILEEHIPNVEVCQAMNGEEALQLYEKKQPSIILADINIPKFSGLEVIRRIQSYGKDCEFLILSSYDYFEKVLSSKIYYYCSLVDYAIDMSKHET